MAHSANRQAANGLPSEPGTYVLIIRLDAPATIPVGRLGLFDLPAGRYAYVGSAHGPGGLQARVRRHLRPSKQHHWHIDHLTARAPVVAVWALASAARLECAWAQALAAQPGVARPIRGFGASDCRCTAHLFHLERCTLDAARRALGWPPLGLDGPGK